MLQSKYEIECGTESPEYEFYQEFYVLLEGAIIEILSRLDIIRKYRVTKHDKDPIEHCKARIKSADSMKEKLIRRNLPVTVKSALTEIYDDEIASTDLNFQAIWDMIEGEQVDE